jgi:iron complex outermembrane receptor protein
MARIRRQTAANAPCPAPARWRSGRPGRPPDAGRPAAGRSGPDHPDAPQRIEITGSAIKRIDGETALPVQVITREEIDKAGLTTASEIVARLSASAANLTDGGSIGTGGFHDQTGLNAANLRGMGASSTLVLLNGRRMANFASPGDAAGVDLNTIPAAAIQRVEVLLDGASSLYGSDAIGGVINFITRRDYQGAEVNVSAGDTTEGGAASAPPRWPAASATTAATASTSLPCWMCSRPTA